MTLHQHLGKFIRTKNFMHSSSGILLSGKGVFNPKLTVLLLGTVKIIMLSTIKKIQSHCHSLWDNLMLPIQLFIVATLKSVQGRIMVVANYIKVN